MKEKLKPMSQAFVKNAIGLDGIINALSRNITPEPPDPPVPPVTGNFIKLEFDYSVWDAEVGGHHVAEAIYSVDDNHNIIENISVTKGCQEDSIEYLGDNEIKYTIYNVNEGYPDESTSQSYIIEYNSESDEYGAAWGEGPSILQEPTITKLTSV